MLHALYALSISLHRVSLTTIRLHAFLDHHSTELGFFLDISRFRTSVFGTNSEPPSPFLLNTAYLWGVHLSGSEEWAAYAPAFLSLSVRSAAESLASSHPQKILHGIQAEVLLTYYFLCNVRILEAKYHASAAVSLAISSGLGRMRTTEQSSDYITSLGELGILPPPQDPIEEGERIHGFWTVLTLNNVLAGADGSPSNISYSDPGARIDTPWPLDLEQYSEVSTSSCMIRS